jgi:hypothetical protein
MMRGGTASLAIALAATGRGPARAAAKRGVKFKLGVTDWTLKLAGQPEAVLMAGELGFDCLQVSVGRIPRDGKLVLLGRTLYVVQNFSTQVSVLELSRRFNRGEIVEPISDPGFDFPATAAFLKGALDVTNARFSTPPAPDSCDTVVRVAFEP